MTASGSPRPVTLEDEVRQNTDLMKAFAQETNVSFRYVAAPGTGAAAVTELVRAGGGRQQLRRHVAASRPVNPATNPGLLVL